MSTRCSSSSFSCFNNSMKRDDSITRTNTTRIKKSATTTDLTTTTTKKDVNDHDVQSRDLIREYMSRTRVPPAIFQSTFNNPLPPISPPEHMNLAYKHPILLMDQSEDIYIDHHDANIDNEKNKEIEYFNQNNYNNNNNNNNNNLNDEHNQKEETSFIVPQTKRNAFSSLNSISNTKEKDNTKSPCHLIGKVNPNLIKTWEQLSGSTTTSSSTTRTIDKDKSIEESECSEQQSCVLFYRKPFTFKDDNFYEATDEKFQVNKILHSESSGDFYDSIDEQSIIENTYVVDDLMNSIYQDTEYVGGEGLAAECCDSLDKKKLSCWSIESNEHYINNSNLVVD